MTPKKITPLLLVSFLEIAGHAIIDTYGDQGRKIISIIIDHVIPSVPSTAVASTTKLKLYLEETFMKTKRFPPFKKC
jgi:hypothetical protein